MNTREYLVYESPQPVVVELRMDSALLQASKPDYIEGGDDIWVTFSVNDVELF
jgi:hypothetical protein